MGVGMSCAIEDKVCSQEASAYEDAGHVLQPYAVGS